MPPKKQLSEIKRAQIVAFPGEGYSLVEIARKMECSRKGVQTTIKRYKETKSFKNRKGQGRKKSTTTREDRFLKRASLADRRKISSELAVELREGANKNISSNSEKKVIRSGIKRMQSLEEAILVSGQQEKTTGICKKYENWTPDDWGKIVWSDESNFEVS